jgi:hypothetical protein
LDVGSIPTVSTKYIFGGFLFVVTRTIILPFWQRYASKNLWQYYASKPVKDL